MNDNVAGHGPNAIAELSRYRRAMLVAVLISSGPLMGLIIVGVAPILPMLAHEYGGDAKAAWIAQLLLTVPSAGIMLGGPLTGWLVERFGPRRVMTYGLASYIVAGGIGMITLEPHILLPARFVAGLGAVAVATASMAVLGAEFEEGERAKILGYQGAVGSLFGIVGVLLAGEIAEGFGIKANFALYLGAAIVLGMAVAAMPLRLTKAPRKSTDAPSSQLLLGLWPLYFLYTLIFCASFMPSVQLGFLLTVDGVTSVAIISRVLAGSAIGTAAGSWAFSILGSKIGHGFASIIALVLWSAGLLAIGMRPGVVWTSAGAVVTGIGFGLFMPYAASLLLRKAAPEVRGRAMGLFYTAIYLGDFVSPFMTMPIRDAIGVHGLFSVTGGAIGVAALIKAAAGSRRGAC